MRIIRDTKWFHILQSGGSLQDCIDNEPVNSQNYCQELLTLAGGLDHVKITKNQAIFSDIGLNGKDRSFMLRASNPDES